MTEKARLIDAAVAENARHAKKLGWIAVVMGGLSGLALVAADSVLTLQFAAPFLAAVIFLWRCSDRMRSVEQIAENGHDSFPIVSTAPPDTDDVQIMERYLSMVHASNGNLVHGEVVTVAQLPASKIRIKTVLSEAIRSSRSEGEQGDLSVGYLSLCAFQPIPQGYEDLAASVARAETLQLADELAVIRKSTTGGQRLPRNTANGTLMN